MPQIAIVGSRNPTVCGLQTAQVFSAQLARHGLVITSGLANGIDAASHKQALEQGLTIAVMGCGLKTIYPRRNRALAKRIAEHGVLVSEFPLDAKPQRRHFPQRNRIISGLSYATLVIEATTRSGSLITAKHALEQGREVMAIPGSIHSPLARGCHFLIKQGAKLIENVEDISEELPFDLSQKSDTEQNATQEHIVRLPASVDSVLTSAPDYVLLQDAIGYEPTAFDTLITRTGLTAEAISSMLLILELNGAIENRPGGLYMRCAKSD